MQKPRISLRKRGDVHLGEICMPMQGGKIKVATVGWNPMSALRRAASAALQIATDPTIAPFLPPQVQLAVRTARALTQLTIPGLVAVSKEGSPATRKLALAMLTKVKDDIEDRDLQAEVDQEIKRAVAMQKVSGVSDVGARSGRSGRALRRAMGLKGAPKSKRGARSGVRPAGAGMRGDYARANETAQPPPPVDQYGNPVPVDQYGNPIPQPGPVDQYGNPVPVDQYGNPYPQPYPQPGYPSPADQQAMAAWGQSAFTPQEQWMQPTPPADSYFEAYEDLHESEDADELVEYGEDEGGMEYGPDITEGRAP
jgi:hypothetical protein